jgi:adenine nucleotide transporter 17
MARARGLKRAAGLKPRVGPAGIFVLSSLAKVGATLATYPMLVVKSRLQAANADTHDSLRYTGVADALRRMWAAEGLAGLYRGMRVKLAQTVAAAALMMVLKEEIYEWTHAALAGAPPPGGR